MRYSQLRDLDIVNGLDIGAALFVQGCPLHCPNCFNQSTWDFKGGKEFTKELQDKFIDACKKPYIRGISLLGGEPLQQPHDEIKAFLKRLKTLNKTIYVWTGSTFEELIKSPYRDCLPYIDFLIDGKFDKNLQDFRLHLRGSSNQRIIDVKTTLNNTKIGFFTIC
jgi:anaerobic ribonucleoside-triphosphate reductase activating protein